MPDLFSLAAIELCHIDRHPLLVTDRDLRISIKQLLLEHMHSIDWRMLLPSFVFDGHAPDDPQAGLYAQIQVSFILRLYFPIELPNVESNYRLPYPIRNLGFGGQTWLSFGSFIIILVLFFKYHVQGLHIHNTACQDRCGQAVKLEALGPSLILDPRCL